MKLVRMKALKPTRYRTRRLLAGEEFDAAPSSARLYTKLKRAAPVEKVAPAVAAAIARPTGAWPAAPGIGNHNPVAELAAEYERIAGVAPDRRWGEPRLTREMEVLKAGADAAPATDLPDGLPADGE